VTITAGAFQNDGSTIQTSAKQGRGGDISISAGEAQLMKGAVVSATSEGHGNAGNINITATNRFVLRDSTVTTQAQVADGGDITIRAGEVVQMINSGITTSVGQGLGNGGNIAIDPQFVILQNGSQILANAFGGHGGNINIAAGLLLISPDSVINASSEKGVSGTITINSAISDLSGSLTPLPQGFLPAKAVLQSHCAAKYKDGKYSSFVVAGREAIPMEPGGLLPSPLYEAGETRIGATSPDEGYLVALNLGSETLTTNFRSDCD
jgi:large exoprotein involved in heme utilization and adhesion